MSFDLTAATLAYLGVPLTAVLTVMTMIIVRFLLIGVAPGLAVLKLPNWLAGYRIHEKLPSGPQLRDELKWSMSTLVIQFSSWILIKTMTKHGIGHLYKDVSQYGWAYLIFSFLSLFVILDTYVYWTHRLTHTRWLFKHVHARHHYSVQLTAISTISFHPFDAFVQNIFGALLILVMPMHEIAIGVFAVITSLFNYYGHTNLELFPKSWLKHPVLRWGATSLFHNQHHQNGNTNFAVYFRFWDRLMGTENKKYEETMIALHEKRDRIKQPSTAQTSGVGIFMKKALIGLVMVSAFLTLVAYLPIRLLTPRFSRRVVIPRIFQGFSKLALLALGVHVARDKATVRSTPQGSLIVANHVSYLDIPLLASIAPTTFISTVEVSEMPFFGWFMRLLGCLVIERRSRENLKNEIAQVQDALTHGVNIMFFPEAKATDGTDVLKFKRPFFIPAEQKGLTVLVNTIQYEKIDGKECTLENKDRIYWYRQNPIIEHLNQITKVKRIDVRVHSELLRASEYECMGDGTVLSQLAREKIMQRWRPLKSDAPTAPSREPIVSPLRTASKQGVEIGVSGG